MKTTLIAFLLTTILSGCLRWGNYEPAKSTQISNNKTLDISYDDAWARATIYIAKRGLNVKYGDKASGWIITDTVFLHDLQRADSVNRGYLNDKDYIDCGIGENDGSRYTLTTKPRIIVYISLQSVGANKTKIHYEAYSYAYVTHRSSKEYICRLCEYRCFSNGRLEKEFFDEINK